MGTERGMRANIYSAVAEIREEVAANRLGWNVEGLKRIIMPYPKRAQVDAILMNIDDGTWILEGECAYAREGEEASDDYVDEVGTYKGTRAGGGG